MEKLFGKLKPSLVDREIVKIIPLQIWLKNLFRIRHNTLCINFHPLV